MYKVLLEVYLTQREISYSTPFGVASCAVAIEVLEFENQEDATKFFVNIEKEEKSANGAVITRKATCLNF